MELAAARGTAQSGGLILAAIAAVFTIGYVANMLGEHEDWLHELSIDMFPEDGCLHVYGPGEDGVTAFTQLRHRVLAPDHRRRKSRRPRTATGQTDEIVRPAIITGW